MKASYGYHLVVDEELKGLLTVVAPEVSDKFSPEGTFDISINTDIDAAFLQRNLPAIMKIIGIFRQLQNFSSSEQGAALREDIRKSISCNITVKDGNNTVLDRTITKN